MSFSGKKYRRIACENIDELFKITGSRGDWAKLLKCTAPIFSYERLDKDKLFFTLQKDDKSYMYTFTLGVEHEMEKLDGTKVKMTYTLENDNVLIQVIKCPSGKEIQCRREFRENHAEMIITTPGADVRAKVIYEAVP